MDHFQYPPDHRADLLPVAKRLVLSILCIHVQSVEYRYALRLSRHKIFARPRGGFNPLLSVLN